MQRSDVQALFDENDVAVRLTLTSSVDEKGTIHKTLSYNNRTVDITEDQALNIDDLESPKALATLAGGESNAERHEGENDDLFFGPLGQDAYSQYAQAKIEAQFGDASNIKGREGRAAIWENYKGLQAEVATSGNTNVLEATYYYIKRLNGFARKQLEERPADGLGEHLEQITHFTRQFLLDANGKSRYPDVISTHNALLLAEVVAPLHDVLKFLGPPEAQIMPDHEVITAAFVRENFVGRQVIINEQPYILTPEDVKFIAGVIEDHENIEKPNEASRSSYIHGTELERAKALFFISDVLTGALVLPYSSRQTGFFDIGTPEKPGQLDKRFTDLYFRHIDLVKGKIFRPQWGVHTIGDLIETLNTLQTHGLMINNPDGRNASEVLVDAGLQAINQARIANSKRTDRKFSPEQLRAIDSAENNLREMLLAPDAHKAEISPGSAENQEALKRFTETMQLYLSVRGQENAGQIASLVIQSVYLQNPATADQLKALNISQQEFTDLIEQAPVIEIGRMHDELWKRDTRYRERWKAVNVSVPREQRWIDATETYFLQHGRYPDGVRKNPDSNTLEVDIVKVSFAEYPPSRQADSMQSAKRAIESVKQLIASGRQDVLPVYYQTLDAVIAKRAPFDELNNQDVAGVHELGNSNHIYWLERNKEYANYLTKQDYYNMLHIANGNYDQLPDPILQEVLNGAMKDEGIQSAIQTRVAEGTNQDQALREALSSYARDMVLLTIEHAMVPSILSENAQGMVVEDLKYIWGAIYQIIIRDNLNNR